MSPTIACSESPLRRRLIGWSAGSGALVLLGCGSGSDSAAITDSTDSTASSTSTTATSSTAATTTGASATSSSDKVSSCSVIPEETAGPYPGDGSNTSNGSVSNVLSLTGIVRSDIRTSIAGASGTAAGVALTVTLRLVNTGGACADLSGYAIYLWHADQQGRYSLYSSGVTGENYLRGVQETDANGHATFVTVFPGCYDGRMPHIHFEIYRSLASAGSYQSKLRTSQIAFPIDTCRAIYAGASGYATSVTNLARISFATDNVFSDGYSTQLASLEGSIEQGYASALTVGIAA